MSVKQVIVVRKDLNMRKGKMCAQAAHASMKVLLDQANIDDGELFLAFKGAMGEWLLGSFTKIVCSVDSEQELLAIHEKAKGLSIVTSLIQDAGLTEFKEPTYTAVAVGPDYSDKVDQVTGSLPLI